MTLLILEANLNDIEIAADRARDFDPAAAQALADILKVQPLQHPIRLRTVDGKLRLVAGLLRLEAFRLNSATAIPYTLSPASNDDEARLEEVMENLGRAELSALDRCHHLYELKQVYERLHPEIKHGGSRENNEIGSKWQNLPLAEQDRQVFRFSTHASEAIGLSERAIRLAVTIWKGLAVSSRKRCRSTWLAGHQGNLRALSEQTPALQGKILDLILADQPQATSVADALIIIQNGRLPNHVEKKFASLNKSIKSLKDDELDTVFAAHEDRLVNWLKRTGRI